MLTDITALSLKGANFITSTNLQLFESEKAERVQATLLYGGNGAGKSSVARAIRLLKGESPIPTIEEAHFLDHFGNNIELTESEKNTQLFVFDEDFVDRNVKVQSDHLDTIIMLGEAVDLTEKIELAEQAKMTAEQNKLQNQDVYQEYLDEKNVKSPYYYLKSIAKKLRGDGNWSGRERKITRSKQNAPVDENTYKRFIALTPVDDRNQLLLDFEIKIKELEQARSGSRVIKREVPSFTDLDLFDEKIVQDLLRIKIEEPTLSDREKRLFSLLSQETSKELEYKLSFFQDSKRSECPFCFQPLSAQYKHLLAENIEKILNKVVKSHQLHLRSYHINTKCNIELSDFCELQNCSICNDLIGKVNEEIDRINLLIESKIQNPYRPISETINLHELVKQLSTNLKTLEDQRLEFNGKAIETESLVNELHEINDQLAALEIKDQVELLKQQQLEFQLIEDEYEKSKKTYLEAEQNLLALEAARKNVHIAVDSLNACLAYIFFSNDRLKIEYSEGVYKLKSRGKSVRPCDISVGERNIIGLCYFFMTIMEGQEENKAYEREYFLIFDDPISSYDRENKIGIMSFLKYKFNQFFSRNSRSRFLVMTHDITSVYDVKKIYDDLFQVSNFFELKDKTLEKFPFKKRQEYTELLKKIYDFAKGGISEYDLVIGNIMRQALEAFSTFEYRMGIEQIASEGRVLNLLNKPELRTYFRNLMYRLVLNGGSHRQEQVQTLVTLDFLSMTSESEKRRIARDILCFMYMLNPTHLIEHLNSSGRKKDNPQEQLDRWCEDIEKLSPPV